MTSKEFLISKGWHHVEDDGSVEMPVSDIVALLDEYAAQATTKIDVSKEFVNLTAKYEEGKDGYFIEDAPMGKVWVPDAENKKANG